MDSVALQPTVPAAVPALPPERLVSLRLPFVRRHSHALLLPPSGTTSMHRIQAAPQWPPGSGKLRYHEPRCPAS